MNSPIRPSQPLLLSLCPELRDAVFAQTGSVADARKLNAALGEERDISVWAQAAHTHLPHVARLLSPAQNKTLATQLRASETLGYADCFEVWETMDADALWAAATSFAATEDEKSLKLTLLSDVLRSHIKPIEDKMGDDVTGDELSMFMLYHALDNTLWEGRIESKMELVLDAGVKALPAVMAGFDHVEHLTLRCLSDDVDLAVLRQMRGLTNIVLEFAPGAGLQWPQGLLGKSVELRTSAASERTVA